MLLALLIVSVIVNIFLVYGVLNVVKKTELLEDFLGAIQEKIGQILRNMRQLDNREMFEKDDDVGVIFGQIVSIVGDLDLFLGTTSDEERK